MGYRLLKIESLRTNKRKNTAMRYYHNNIQNYRGSAKLLVVLLAFLLARGVATAQVTIGGSVYGGGNKAAGIVTGTVNVEVKAGTVTHSVYGGGNLAEVSGATQVTIDSVGKVNHSVFGGGHAANVTSANVIINNGTVGASGGTGLYGVYGGCDSMGTVSGAIAVNINGGTLGTSLLGIFGGGYGAKTITGGNVTVTIGDMNGRKKPTLNTDIYGGSALGSVNSNTNNLTKVDFLNGTLSGNIYGGGLGKSGDENVDSGMVKGNVQVNIGAEAQHPDSCFISLVGRSIYGCNNTNGSPKGNVAVNIYKTAHTDADDTTQSNTAYAIANVFGGGRNAHYIPSNNNGRATVTVYSCENTIGRVFGGGDAADAYGVGVEIYGGRFNQIFGGGNGEIENTEANIGGGGTSTQVHGGYINQLFGGSNERGTISGPMNTSVENSGGCPEKIRDFFGGSNKVPIIGDITTTIACGAIFENVYGGSNEADITGNVTLNINGGTITNVYGGSKGATDKGADIKDDGSGTMGTVTLNLTGGTITNAFGGSNINGNIDNLITVNVNENESLDSACALHITNIYGASNLASYEPKTASIVSPLININHIKAGSAIAGNVYGGGKGAKSIFYTNGTIKIDSSEMGRCISNPRVNLGDSNAEHFVKIHGNVYGGGALSYVKGYTKVNMFNANDTAIRTVVEGSIFGAGQGYVGDLKAARITDSAVVNLIGGRVKTNVYGGGELAQVKGDAKVRIQQGNAIIAGNLFGAGKGDKADVAYGGAKNTLVNMYGGTVQGNLYGGGELSSVDTVTVAISGGTLGELKAANALTMKGNVFGGSLGLIDTGYTTYSNVKDSWVAVSDSALIVGSVYGGGENGRVMNNTNVAVTGGTIGRPLTLAERKTDEYVQLERIYTGNVYGGGSGATILRHDGEVPVFYDSAGTVYGNTNVTVSDSAVVRHNVYGGGNMASVGKFTANKITGIASYTSGGLAKVTISGNALIGPKKKDLLSDNSDTLKNNFKYLGANEGSVFGSSRGLSGGLLKHLAFADSTVVTISGNAQVVGNVFGGGENGHVQKGTNVIISGGVIGGIPLHDTLHTVSGGEYDGVTVHLASGESEIYEDEYSAGARVQRGNVFGGGKGTDSILWQHPFKYCYTAGRVYGNAHVTVGDSAQIYNRVYGGGAVASVGTFKNTDPTNSHAVTGIDSVGGKPTGTTYVTINGGRIGTNGRNNGDVFGGGKGLAGGANSLQKGGTQVVDEAYVGNTYVTVNGGTIASSVYGGSANGHVQGDAHVTINDTNRTNPTVIGTPGLGGWHGNVYGGGGGTNRYPIAANKTKHSITSGRVFGNTEVTVNGGHILHNVYGGGAVASIGTYNLDDPSNLWVSGGTAEVKVLGGTIGTDGHENGMVYGSGRGEVDYSFFDSLAYATNAVVTIGTNSGDFITPIIKGSVYGSGENGHVFQKATVNVYSGTIGCDSAEYAAMDSIQKADYFPFRGNVYGAGCGTDLTPEGKYNSLAGVVQGNTEVNIHGGYISRNVYGAGAMASVGSITDTIGHRDVATTFALSWPMALTYAEGTGTAVVNITGGHIGTVKAPEGTSGDVYGSARGEAGDRYKFANLANVHTAKVTVDFSPSPTNVIVGSVYGSGENGHVYDSTLVTLNNGLINGSLFGGGKGTDKYIDHLKDTSTDALYDAEVYDITAGKVYGNTHVVMNGGRVEKNVYGGGNLASVGIGNFKGYGEGSNVSQADSLLAENSGHCYVNILGGIVGPDSLVNGTAYNGAYAVTTGNVYGAGKGIVFPAAPKEGYDYGRDYFMACVNKTTVIFGDSTQRSCAASILYPQATGEVFGGGENGRVRFDTYIQTNRGQIGVRPTANDNNLTSDMGHWNNRGNVFGAGRGEDKNTDGTYCQSAGHVGRNTTIDILGARIYRNVQAGGSMASVGPFKGYTGDSSTCVINVRLPQVGDTLGGPSNTGNAFGGYVGGGSRGIPSPDGTNNSHLATCHNSQVNIYQGRLKNTIYGGGENGQMLGNTEINVYGGYIRSAIYGGGKGSWKASADEAGMPGTYNNDTLSGYIAGNTIVNLLGGTVPFTYGGCRRASVGGNTTINIGEDSAGTGNYKGDVEFVNEIINGKSNIKNKVYGGNQYAGTPKGDITVNVYSTAHGDDPAHNKYPAGVKDSAGLARNDSIQTYAIGAVYGGSYNSNYLPRPGHSATVHVYGCENTIQELYGGGAAADVGDNNVNANTNLIIDGGRFRKVFGGGDGTIDRNIGQQVPANIHGTATTIIHSGLITEFYGGSNQMGNVKVISTQIDDADSTRCPEVIGNLYSGSNESDIYGDGELIIACGAGKFNEVYGGSNNAQIHGNVTLTIRGGEIGTVFGGSKGRVDDPTTAADETFAANIDGNVTLNLEGGTIGEAFGGSNINGAIHGIITVNVLDTCQDCPLKVENVYGAGNITPYKPNPIDTAFDVNGDTVFHYPSSPVVNIKHTATPTTFTGSVYGGGFGTGAVVTANPVVTIGDTSHLHTALVGTNVFGGGSFAEVKGNTTVLIQNPNTRVSGAIYGGGALADVRSTNVTLNSGTVGGNIYGGGLGRNDIAAKVNGDVQVTINGGKAANIYGANNINGAPTGAVKVDIYGTDLPASGYALGNVFGGGNHAVYDSIPQVTIHNCNNKIEYVYGGGNAASVKGTDVTVYGGDTIGNVYGGCYGANVTKKGTKVNIHGGTIGSVFGGNNASGTITGDILVNVDKQAEGTDDACEMHISRVYGGGNKANSQAGHISIGCTGGENEGIDTVYGGANQANIAGAIVLDITGGHIGNVFGGNNISGNTPLPSSVL